MGQVFLDSFLDVLKLLPFLLLLYVLIELLEHRTALGRPGRALTGKLAPLVGSAAGLVPMCGFSVMASKLYQKRFITVGTLFAVFIATSDEALLVLALSQAPIWHKTYSILALLGCKFVLAVGVGYLIDFVAKRTRGAALSRDFEEERAEPQCRDVHEYGGGTHGDVHEHGEEERETEHESGADVSVCEHRHESIWTLYVFSPLLHALEVGAAVFVCYVAFGLLLYWVGEEKVFGFLQGAGYWYQPLVAALVGLIPNCASSVALSEAYALGGIGFSALLGGLVTNAGFGVFVLFRDLKAWKRNLLILGATFALGALFGYAASAIEFFL